MSGDSLDAYLKQINSYKLLTPAEELVLGRQIQLGNQEGASKADIKAARKAREKMIKANLRLAVKVAYKYQPQVTKSEFADLISCATEGLITAVERYDPTRGYRFSTMAFWWCRQGACKYLSDHSRPIRLPTSRIDIIRKMNNIKHQEWLTKGKEVSAKEVCDSIGVTLDHLKRLLSCSNLKSLDEKAVEDGSPLVELICYEEKEQDPDLAKLANAMDELSELTATVIDLVYVEKMTIQDVMLHTGLEKDDVERHLKSGITRLTRIMKGMSLINTVNAIYGSQMNIFDK